MRRWYAIYTQPRNESRAADHLMRQGFDIYFPRYLKRRSHARRVSLAPSPLFPRYLFVGFDVEDAGWRVVRSTRGVADLVRNGNDPVPVPDAIIDEMRRREDPEGFVIVDRHLKLGRGARIKIDSGPFADCEAIFESQRDDERVVALLSLLGRKVVVQLPISAIAPAD